MVLEEGEAGLRCRLVGRLDAQATEEVRRALVGASVGIVDVSEVRLVDEAALVLLEDLATAGARLEGVSPYLALRLEAGRSPTGKKGASKS
jgi:anti-anti-sigma regulatory factor